MNISNEQVDAAKAGHAVEIEAGDTTLVLIRSDLLDSLHGNLPPDIIARVIDDSMHEFDAADPLLDSYQKYA